jgi:hypothetical protein
MQSVIGNQHSVTFSFLQKAANTKLKALKKLLLKGLPHQFEFG